MKNFPYHHIVIDVVSCLFHNVSRGVVFTLFCDVVYFTIHDAGMAVGTAVVEVWDVVVLLISRCDHWGSFLSLNVARNVF